MEGGKPAAFDRAPGAGRGRGRGFGVSGGNSSSSSSGGAATATSSGPQAPGPGGVRAQGHGDGAQENGLCAVPGSGPGVGPAVGTGPGAAAAAANGAAIVQGNGVHVKSGIQQQEPLRQPRSSPPAAEYSESSSRGQMALGSHDQYLSHSTNTAMVKPQRMEAFTIQSKLSASAPEFYPPGFMAVQSKVPDEAFVDFEIPSDLILADYLHDFLTLLTSLPGSFELEIVQFTEMMNGWVNTDEALQEVVEIIYQQATTVPNFTYTGARLCNYLSQNLTINPRNNNFRQLLLQRCQTEYVKRDEAVKGDEKTRKKFHSFVLFLGELYLNLEVKGANGAPARAEILQTGLRELLNSLFSQPMDDNLICAVKLLKLTGSVLEDAWKGQGKSDMDEIIQRVENVVLDSNSSRDVKQMLLKLVELRSSNWGRVHTAATYNEATPENDPNYYMNEPVFYSAEGIPLTPADPDYLEKYQEMIDREELFQGYSDEDGEAYLDDSENEMDPEMEEAFEKFCAETENKRK
ncbi:polyadenylate-binding protein-interacting protein 1 [Chiloscyllium plagiosum]|uniref:polyadenylate-binding protein-interacting protein 1 n=1 Tax=Chiloscyllium plagiosum TaxID=36176 RepID=UPI001CB7F1F2|nr:polyadenylate-binding protein-interacting protein 1 [Chiloscyllium plagiosum]